MTRQVLNKFLLAICAVSLGILPAHCRGQLEVLDLVSVAPDGGVLHECYVGFDNTTAANYLGIQEGCSQSRNGTPINPTYIDSTNTIYGHSDNAWAPTDTFQVSTYGYLDMFNNGSYYIDPMGYNGSTLCGPFISGLNGSPPVQYEWCPNGSLGYYTSSYIFRYTVDPTLTMPVRPYLTPASATVVAGHTQQFQAFSLDSAGRQTLTPANVTWSISAGSTAHGTINSSGLYTAPSTYTAGTSDTIIATGAVCPFCSNYTSTGLASVTISPAGPNITGISVGNGAASLQAAPTAQTATVTLTGSNFGSVAPTIQAASGSTGISVVPGSVTSPSGSPSAQTVSFQIMVASDAPAENTDFQMTTIVSGQDLYGTSPTINILALQPVAPVILDLLAADNNYNCSAGNNIGQGATTAQQVVVGQLVSFTACVPQAGFTFGAFLTGSASWNSPTFAVPYTFSNYAVQDYVVSNYMPFPAGYPFIVNGPGYPTSAVVAPVVDSPLCNTSSAFCDFQRFAFVVPGTYDFVFSYQLGNGTQSVSATVEYIVSGPSQQPSVVSVGQTQIIPPSLGTLGQLASGNNGAIATSGIVFNAIPWPSSLAGAYQWIQKIIWRNPQYLNTNNVQFTNNQPFPSLDNMYPYPGDLGSPQSTEDTPSMWLHNSYTLPSGAITNIYEENDHFAAQMYLMWDPELNADGSSNPGCAAKNVRGLANSFTVSVSACSGSIPVPLGSMAWGFCGTAINTLSPQASGGTWILSCPPNGQNPIAPVMHPVQGSTDYPVWSSVYLNSSQ